MSEKRRKRQRAVDRFLDLEAHSSDEQDGEEEEDGGEAAMESFIQEDSEAGSDQEEEEGDGDRIEVFFGGNGNAHMSTDEHREDQNGHHEHSPFEDPFTNATSEHQESEHLAALFRDRARSRPGLKHHDFDDAFMEATRKDDAPLWQVPVRRGTEEAAVWYISKHMEALGDENPPLVISAFARTIGPGYIFVEALSAADVRRVCEGFVGYQGRYKKINLVVDDAVTLLEYQHPDLMLRANSWVRLKRGMYAGDLAFLCRVDVADPEDERFRRTQGTVYLRVIPRIPGDTTQLSVKRKRRAVRAPQQFFDPFRWPGEAFKLPEANDPNGWVFRRGVFNSGLLNLEVPLNPLNLGIATPSRSELQFWATSPDSDMQCFALKSLKTLAEEFWVDDRVEVISGDFLGRVGVVSKVVEESVSVFLWKDILGGNGQQESSSMEVELISASIRKVFRIGDYVEAVVDDKKPRRGFVIAINQTEGKRDTVIITERGCQDEFACGSSILHLRDAQESPFSSRRDDEKLRRLAPFHAQRNLSKNRACLQNLLTGMPVVVLDKVAKGYQGYIGAVHEIYEKDNGKDSKGNSIPYVNPDIKKKNIQHECIGGCRSCLSGALAGHICAKTCHCCFLDSQPIFQEETPGMDFLVVVRVEVYVPAQSKLHMIDISDLRPADNILTRTEYLRACRTKDIYLHLKVPNVNDVRWFDDATKLRWQDATLMLISIQQMFSSRSFPKLCEGIYERCVQRKCNEADVMPACNHDIASYDAVVKPRNKFNHIPFWHQEKREFDALCRYIVEDCRVRRCDRWSSSDCLKHLPPCEHDTASHEAVVKILGQNRLGLVPCWNQAEHPTSDSRLDPLILPRELEDQQPYAQTPHWKPDHEYPDDSAWNPDSFKDPYWEPESEKSIVDEHWLDESLRGLQTGLYLNMASGSRAHSRNTEGIKAKLVPSRERGNIIDVYLQWENHPKQLYDLPIRCVVPRHPGAEHKGDPVVFIRGPSKGQFGVVHAVDGERVTIGEIRKKKDRRKRPSATEHAVHDLTLCQWPKRT